MCAAPRVTAAAEPIDREPLKTLFNLDYHLAELRAKTGDPNYASWFKRRGLLVLDPLRSKGLLPTPLEIQGERLSQLMSGRYLRHALGTCASAIVLAASAKLDPELTSWLNVAHSMDAFEKLWPRFEPQIPKLVPTQAYAKFAFDSDCKVSKLKTKFSFDSFDVTSVSLCFEVNRPIGDFVKGYDPRMWDFEAPEAFKVSDRIAVAEKTAAVPGSTDPAPPPVLPTPAQELAEAGLSGNFPFYENAVTAAGGEALTDFKNILAIDYQVVPQPDPEKITLDPDTITLTYALCEAITFVIEGSACAGGLDRDSGRAVLKKLSSSSTQIFASKSVRISAPRAMRELLNSNMAAALPFWFWNLVLLGVCKGADA